MSRNPYADVGAGADPYVNGNGYRAHAPATDDYDPYGERYGTPPTGASNATRDRRAGGSGGRGGGRGDGRAGGYGGFYENSNGSAPAVQAVAGNAEYGNDGYGEDPAPPRSPRRNATSANNNRRQRQEYGNAGSEDRNPSFEYRRGGERQYTNGNGLGNELVVGRNRGNARSGGDGTRQIEGQ